VIDRKPRGRAVQDGAVVASEDLALSWWDPAVQWGLAVFETIAVRGAVPRQLVDHLQRLAAAALRFGVPIPATAELAEAAHVVAADVGDGDAWLKIVVSRSGRWAAFAGAASDGERGRPVSAIVLPWRRHRLDPTAGLKSTSYAAHLLGIQEARRRGADEGLWLNDRGHVFEACTGNLFVVRGRAVVTPAIADGARDGVTRARAIPALRAFGLSVRLSKVRLPALRAADDIFLTSSVNGVRPVVRVDGKDVRGGQPGPTSRRLAERLDAEESAHRAVDGGGRRGV